MENIKNFILYKHTSPSGKCYIGITCLKPEERWGNNGFRYIEIKQDGKFKHPKFANAILKYGWDNIKHEILYTNLSKDDACKLEKEYILKYKEGGKSYNITDGGEGTCGHKFTEEQKRKQSERHIGLKQSAETIEKRVSKLRGKKRPESDFENVVKSVDLYTLDGIFIRTFKSIKEAGEALNITKSHISSCCKHTRKSAGGFLWECHGNQPIKYKKDNARRIIVYLYKNGILVNKFDSIKETSIQTNIPVYLLKKNIVNKSIINEYLFTYEEL